MKVWMKVLCTVILMAVLCGCESSEEAREQQSAPLETTEQSLKQSGQASPSAEKADGTASSTSPLYHTRGYMEH